MKKESRKQPQQEKKMTTTKEELNTSDKAGKIRMPNNKTDKGTTSNTEGF